MTDDLTQEMVDEAISDAFGDVPQATWLRGYVEPPLHKESVSRKFDFSTHVSHTTKGMVRVIRKALLDASDEHGAGIIWRSRPMLSIDDKTGDDSIRYRFMAVEAPLVHYVKAVHEAEQVYFRASGLVTGGDA